MAYTLLTVCDIRVAFFVFIMIVFMLASLLHYFRGQADSTIFYAMVEAGMDLSTLITAFVDLAVSGAMI